MGFIGCSQRRQWNHEERKAMREALRDYRQMTYLNDLSDDEYVVFTDGVATDLETAYPVYTTFIGMPGVNDTVDMVVVTAIVDELNADARNMRHIYHKHCTNFITYFSKPLKIYGSCIGTSTRNNHLGFAFQSQLSHFVVIQKAVVIYPIRYYFKIFA